MLNSIAQEVNALRAPASVYRNISMGTTGGVVSSVPAEVVTVIAGNTDGSANAYVKLYNKATAATSSDTPIYTILVAAKATVIASFVRPLGGFAAGISVRATLNAADNDNTAPTSAVVVNIGHIPTV